MTGHQKLRPGEGGIAVNMAVSTEIDSAGNTGTAPVSLARVLVALDQSDYAIR